MELKPYRRTVQYYETDQMAIVHHSNYIRWFEEARLDQLTQLDIHYPLLEAKGIIIPVVDINCSYLVSARYGDEVFIHPTLVQYSGVRMVYHYEVRHAVTDQLLATGSSTHCFLDEQRRPISLKRREPELHQLLQNLVP